MWTSADECMHVVCEGVHVKVCVQVNVDENVCVNVHACTICVSM